MKYLVPLLLVAFSGFAAEPPAVKSKAAQELLKHPEFKKALEAAPELGKLLEELDKHAPEIKQPKSEDTQLDKELYWRAKHPFTRPFYVKPEVLVVGDRVSLGFKSGINPVKLDVEPNADFRWGIRVFDDSISLRYYEIDITDKTSYDDIVIIARFSRKDFETFKKFYEKTFQDVLAMRARERERFKSIPGYKGSFIELTDKDQTGYLKLLKESAQTRYSVSSSLKQGEPFFRLEISDRTDFTSDFSISTEKGMTELGRIMAWVILNKDELFEQQAAMRKKLK